MTPQLFKERFLVISGWLYSIAFSFLGNRCDAEDAVQTLFLKLWQLREELDDVENVRAYCRQMLLNICIDRWRQINYRGADVPERDLPDTGTVDELEARSQEEYIRWCIESLPDRQQRIILMSMSGAKGKDIAEVTGLSIENVRTTLSRIRKLLRKKYNEG
ncbi:MAG: sigma-70 family RNA polymerase sigma factor [Bacteroidaceae bacterium]|nr:sigma-70 family RNA polymerase sigma factor [Bacteroidaceae bacterium]